MSAVDYNKQNAVHVEDETASKDKPIYYENANPEGEVLETRYARELGEGNHNVMGAETHTPNR
jgi:hypothetical protein